MTGNQAKPKMTDEERSELMKKMDEDLAEHFAKLEAKAKERGPRGQMVEGFTEDNWEEELANHPFFKEQFEDGEELSPLMQGLQDLKYSPDDNTPEELAKNYKEDGNFNFKCKKYRFAVASYTEGLKAKCSDSELNAQLLTNRAAAQFHIGNFRSSFLDCRAALKVWPGHMKAIVRGAECQSRLKHFNACVEWCEQGLEIDPQHQQLLKLRQDSVNQEKALERDRRKQQMEEKRKKVAETVLMDLIKQRGIKVSGVRGDSGLDLSDLEPCHPAALHKKVHVEENILVWPVLFLYPEFGETDFIEEFRETDRFFDHLEVMFGVGVERPHWDTEARYTPASIVIYFEDCDANIVEVSPDFTLCQALTNHKFLLKAGTPGFILLVRDSVVHHDFLSKYSLVKVVSGSVSVGGEVVSSIGRGMVALIGIHRDDTKADMEYIVRKLVSLRMWEDDTGRRWAKSAKDLDYEILCVSQFTLYHVMKGNKPDFHLAMAGENSKLFYDEFLTEMKKAHSEERIKDGVFGAMMEVNIVNDGPVTLELDSANNAAADKKTKS